MTAGETPGGHLFEHLVLFGRFLRALGLEVGPGQVITLGEALKYIDITNRQEFFYAARAILVSRREDLPIFDLAFEYFWRPRRNPLLIPVEVNPELVRRQLRMPPAEMFRPADEKPPERRRDELVVLEKQLTYSPVEVLRKKNFEAFTWERVSLGGPVFDLEKLRWLNGKYIREVLPLEEVAERAKPFLQAAGLSWPSEAYLRRAVELMRPRFDTLKELPEKAPYLFSEDYPFTEKALEKMREGLPVLREVEPLLRAQEDWSEAALDALLRGFAQERGLKLGQVAQPLRAALTGSLETPGLFEIMALLGKERVLARLARALAGGTS